MKNNNARTSDLSIMTAAIYRVVLPAAAVIVASTVLAIPGYYETMTLWYKTGVDRTMLLAGQYVGLAALILIYLQVVMGVHGSVMGRIFGHANAVRFHRINGAVIAGAATAHVLLVLIPEGLSNLPLGKKFWPEMIGAALFLMIILQSFTSLFRTTLQLPFRIWSRFHKPAGYLAVVLVTVHVLFVSDSFEHPIPRILVAALFLLTAVTAAWTRIQSNRAASASPITGETHETKPDSPDH